MEYGQTNFRSDYRFVPSICFPSEKQTSDLGFDSHSAAKDLRISYQILSIRFAVFKNKDVVCASLRAYKRMGNISKLGWVSPELIKQV